MNNQQREFNQERFRKDWIARQVVTVFGWLVLATFLLIIWHIFSNAFPLFKTPQAALSETYISDTQATSSRSAPQETTLSFHSMLELSNGYHTLAVDSCDLVVYANARQATPTFLSAARIAEATAYRSLQEVKRVPFSCQHQFVFPSSGNFDYTGVITPSGLFELYKLRYTGSAYEFTLESSIALRKEHAFGKVFSLSISNNYVMLGSLDKTQLHTYWFDKLHPERFEYRTFDNVQHFQLISRSRQLVTINENVWTLYDKDKQQLDLQILRAPIQQLIMAPSQRAMFTLNSRGEFSKWLMQNQGGKFVFTENVSDVADLDKRIASIAFDSNSNAALVFFEDRSHAFLNRVTNQLFGEQNLGVNADTSYWFNESVYVVVSDRVYELTIRDLQGITTAKSLFAEVWYEGHASPEFVWQTSSATAHYETKMSIVPLIIGSLKASFLALFVAIPLALGAAVYTSFFADPKIRHYIKPAIEMLEAVPSVVIGFIAAVWLVPIAEEFLLSVILFLILLPIALVSSAMLHTKISNLIKDRVGQQWELAFIASGVILLGLFCFSLSDVWRLLLFGTEALAESGSNSAQVLNISKTTIVVAIALGVAISPSIYSLAEDALFEVPDSIKQASYALGATKLQTLRNVIIAVAFPSILSAIMLGFGRAFGETMIVLMVTGNTAISDWNILEGLRSMTANLAIELSEASSDSSHFNILFLTAGILFIFTFIVNTAAEILRNRLRLLYNYA
ncbi:ABC transporter permease subunit [Brumicola blandensis]|uniref:ABC transporter permease subunit n=1 Tax=Brumicola blandensis TaxID=3075611 RepID=A0AAW8R3E9_9ALTE|nr:ABC transporter permease subunit [Alteromonas sp. W409]MDT0583234.1 ABC transporter permease subunit [Alteromonas sp. W409]